MGCGHPFWPDAGVPDRVRLALFGPSPPTPSARVPPLQRSASCPRCPRTIDHYAGGLNTLGEAGPNAAQWEVRGLSLRISQRCFHVPSMTSWAEALRKDWGKILHELGEDGFLFFRGAGFSRNKFACSAVQAASACLAPCTLSVDPLSVFLVFCRAMTIRCRCVSRPAKRRRGAFWRWRGKAQKQKAASLRKRPLSFGAFARLTS